MPTVGNTGTVGALVQAIRDGLPAGFEWSETELVLLEVARRQAADIDALEADIAARGLRVGGARGQPILNDAIREVRQQRVALCRVLGQIDVPDRAVRPRSLHARKAAEGRWRKAS